MRTRSRSNFKRALVAGATLLLVITFPTALLADSVDLPKTGQTKCYHQDGYEIECTDTRQDGDIQAGVAWPDPRFTDNGDGTLTDHLTGLMWLKDTECMGGPIAWQAALDNVAVFNQDPASLNCYQYNYQALSYDDWRLPNINELESLVHSGMASQYEWLSNQGFYNIEGFYAWSSTTAIGAPGRAWFLLLTDGSVGHGYKPHGNISGYPSNPKMGVLLVRSAE
jgi:hypothetical protein